MKERVIRVGSKRMPIPYRLLQKFLSKYKIEGFDKLVAMVSDEKNTLQTIGDEFGVSRERVRQWIRDYRLKEAIGFKSGRERRNGYESKQREERGESMFRLLKWEKRILKEAEENGYEWIPEYTYDNGRITHRSFYINRRLCILRNATHRIVPNEENGTKYARYRVRLLRHPEAEFLVLWVAEMRKVAVIPTELLQDKVNIHFRLTDRKNGEEEWSGFLGEWGNLE
jgi:hypothetical protein